MSSLKNKNNIGSTTFMFLGSKLINSLEKYTYPQCFLLLGYVDKW